MRSCHYAVIQHESMRRRWVSHLAEAMPEGPQGQYGINRCECDHGRLKSRLRPMRGLKSDRTASIVIREHAFVQNLRPGHDELGVNTSPVFRLATAFDELQFAI